MYAFTFAVFINLTVYEYKKKRPSYKPNILLIGI